MSDDNYNNHNDDEYWDDVYFEEHRDEYSSGWSSGGSRGIGKTILLIFLMIWGIMTMLDSPMLGIMIIMLSLVFCK